jgi:RNA polymerase sigma-70 factor, ECF subfamily
VVQQSEEQVIKGIRDGDTACFKALFSDHYDRLCQYAFTLLRDMDEAEDIVQSMFVKLWERRADLAIQQTMKGYLYRFVHNLCINQVEHRQVKQKHLNFASLTTAGEKQLPEVFTNELQENVARVIDQLPEQCKIIFKMSRYEELKYSEIADRLGISPNTVENQISKALKILRSQLDIFVQR